MERNCFCFLQAFSYSTTITSSSSQTEASERYLLQLTSYGLSDSALPFSLSYKLPFSSIAPDQTQGGWFNLDYILYPYELVVGKIMELRTLVFFIDCLNGHWAGLFQHLCTLFGFVW